MKNSRLKMALLFIGMLILFGACADVATVQIQSTDDPYGFWSGLWHGAIAPISFIGSLIYDDVAMYALNNTGGWYDFGFVMGVGALSSGATSSRK